MNRTQDTRYKSFSFPSDKRFKERYKGIKRTTPHTIVLLDEKALFF